MLFNSIQFALFFLVVFFFYLFLNHKWQNRLILVASYAFYAAWDWRFLSLILTSTTLDYICGINIEDSSDISRKKKFLLLSVIGNLSILGVFKYFNFFAFNLQSLLNLLGFSFEPYAFHIILPVGISFYTFKTMSYTIGIYWRQMKPTRRYLDYALFVAFFPALLSGPIDRAYSFLPQIQTPRKLSLDKFYEGCFLVFWGLFQKVFIADNMARIVDPLYASSAPYAGASVLLALYAYVFQLYGDFAGYSNMAIGLGKIMGFDMMNNFNLPLFSTSAADFWRRWHISLSTWVRDYIYTPLFVSLGNLKGHMRLYLTLIITMVILGIWHGAGWNFILFGLYYGILLVITAVTQSKIKIDPSAGAKKNIWLITRVVFMFHITAIGFLLFRATSLSQIYNMMYGLFFHFHITDISLETIEKILSFSVVMVILEIIQFRKNDLMASMKWPALPKAALYLTCFYLLLIFGVSGGKEFIYFQF